MTDRIEGAMCLHATVESLVDAEKKCGAAAAWFRPTGITMNDDTKRKLQERYDRIRSAEQRLREIRKELAAIMGEAYGDVRP